MGVLDQTLRGKWSMASPTNLEAALSSCSHEAVGSSCQWELCLRFFAEQPGKIQSVHPFAVLFWVPCLAGQRHWRSSRRLPPLSQMRADCLWNSTFANAGNLQPNGKRNRVRNTERSGTRDLSWDPHGLDGSEFLQAIRADAAWSQLLPQPNGLRPRPIIWRSEVHIIWTVDG